MHSKQGAPIFLICTLTIPPPPPNLPNQFKQEEEIWEIQLLPDLLGDTMSIMVDGLARAPNNQLLDATIAFLGICHITSEEGLLYFFKNIDGFQKQKVCIQFSFYVTTQS